MKLNLINNRYGRLLVIKESRKNKYSQRTWECLCDCGKKHIVVTSGLTSGRTLSCGCLKIQKINSCKKDLTGKKFGKLLVINKHLSNDKTQVKYKCLCDCGKTTIVSYSNLIHHQRKCGNCILHKNGCAISKKQIELLNIVNKGVLNYKFSKSNKKVVIDIALVFNKRKIAIEYDEWRWHYNKLDKDQERINFLLKNNWRVIRICARNNLPSKKQILDSIHSDLEYYEIILSGWGKL